jgi:hypothetical protein
MMRKQQHLLNSIWGNEGSLIAESGSDSQSFESSDFNIQGINIYRRNLLANAQRALGISFPTVFELLDSDVSEELVFNFLQHCPPSQGDWTQWGEALPNFLSTTEIADYYPYLPDCALLDWHIHCALHGKDQVLAQSSLSLLSDTEPDSIVVEFNDNVTLIKTKYPIAEIFDAHHHSDILVRESSMKQAQALLSRKPESQIVMIFRPEFQPKVTRLTPSESQFMLSVMAGKSLAKSLDAINDYTGFSFEQWLLTAIERNLIYTFKET